MSDESGDPSEHFENSVRSFTDGVKGILVSFAHFVRWFSSWYSESHPLVQLIISGILGGALYQVWTSIGGTFYAVFWESSVPISRDILLQNLPIPVGLAIYILFALWLLTSFSTYSKVIALRERMEKLEAEKQS